MQRAATFCISGSREKYAAKRGSHGRRQRLVSVICSLSGCITDKRKPLYLSTFTYVLVPYLTTLARTDLDGEKMAPS